MIRRPEKSLLVNLGRAMRNMHIIITFRRVLKPAVLDSTQEFRLEKEILEARRMNTYVSFLDLQQCE
jgi:predicted RNA binding protein with dsRBD fold (UPF0201 family)